MSELDFSIFHRFLNPKEDIPKIEALLSFLEEAPSERINEIVPKLKTQYSPMKPDHVVAVSLGGLFSIPNTIASLALFPSIRYVITSPQVEAGQGPFSLSHRVLELAKTLGKEPVIVPFDKYPEYDDAQKLLVRLQGAVILNGLSQEIAAFLSRNLGCGMLVFVKPAGDILMFTVV